MLRRLIALPAAAGLLALSVSGASAAAGTTWTNVPVPDINGVAPTLLSVSCIAADDCVTVGQVAPAGGNDEPMAESWNGTAWTVMSVAVPPRTVGGGLASVSCTAADDCMAVGYDNSTDTKHTLQTLTELWNGSTWTIETAPLTKRRLESVSCASSDFCAAAGEYGTGSTAEGFIELWNGSAWSAAATIPGAWGIDGISCPTTAGCYLNDGQQVYLWDGGTGVTTQQLAVPTGGGPWEAESISCTAAQSCTATGENNGTPLAENWNGSTWAIQPTRVPARTTGSNLASVSCVSTASCTAVGTKGVIHKKLGVEELFGERWNGSGDWGAANIAAPGDGDENQFFGVSCTTAVNCMAVGGYTNTNGWLGLAEVLQPTS
jgi:hypothetical protein